MREHTAQDEQRQLLSRSISVGLLATPVEGATTFGPDTPVRTAAKVLGDQNFDQAPVVEAGVPVGYVLKATLSRARGTVKSCAQDILPNALVAASAPLESVLPWLAENGFLFLLDEREITSFIVPSDLNKQAGRHYFWLGMVELELLLAELARRVDRPLDCLSPGQARKIKERLDEHTAANIEADAVAEMTLPQLFQVVGECSDLPDRVGATDDWKRFWNPVRNIRNRVAHSTKPVLRDQADLGDLLAADRRTHELISAARSLLESA